MHLVWLCLQYAHGAYDRHRLCSEVRHKGLSALAVSFLCEATHHQFFVVSKVLIKIWCCPLRQYYLIRKNKTPIHCTDCHARCPWKLTNGCCLLLPLRVYLTLRLAGFQCDTKTKSSASIAPLAVISVSGWAFSLMQAWKGTNILFYEP